MQQTYFCHICNSGPMSTRQQYDQHLRGKNHVKKASLGGTSMQTDLPDDRRSTVFYAENVVERNPVVVFSDSEDDDDDACGAYGAGGGGGPTAAPSRYPAAPQVEDFPSLGRSSVPQPQPPIAAMAGLSVGRGREVGRGRGSNRVPAPPAPSNAPQVSAPQMSWSRIAQSSVPTAPQPAPSQAPVAKPAELKPLTQSERSGNVRVIREYEPAAAPTTGNRPVAKNPKYMTAKRIYGEYTHNRKTASQAIQEIATTLQWDIEEEEVMPGDFMNFAMRWKINGYPCDKGQGQKKKLAKEEASRLVLKKYARLIESQGEITMEEIDHTAATVHPNGDGDSRRLQQRNHADDYKSHTMSKIDEICRAQQGRLERPVRFAAIFITTSYTQPATQGQLVALGTGRCITKMTNDEAQEACGYRLHDMQAVVMVKRAFQAYLFGQLSQAIAPTRVIGAPKYGETILEYNDQTTRFRLKPGVRIHLYMSHAPAGDATAFENVVVNDADLTDAELTRDLSGTLKPADPDPAKGIGRLRVVVDPYRDVTAILTDSNLERFDKQKTVTADSFSEGHHKMAIMSPADKLMKWIHLGVQGSLLSLFIDPIFLYSIQMGSGYAHEHVARALITRVPLTVFPAMPQNYGCAGDPYIGRSTQVSKLRNQIEGPVALNWFQGATSLEKVNCDEGGIKDGTCSRLSRITMLQRFDARWTACLEQGNVNHTGLFRRLRPYLCNTVKNISYGELKSFADEYQRAKATLYKSLQGNNLGHWRQKDYLQAFCLQDYEDE